MGHQTATSRKWTEFEVEMPWGHISGKWWGSKNVPPILALHGWQDNAGTFDTLIPLLPANMSYLAIDFPGHGLSSYFPEGMMYHQIDFINVLLLLMKKMKWEKVSILGHSMGGVVGLWLASMFPDKVDLLICIDTLKPPQLRKKTYWSEYSKLIKNTLLNDERNQSIREPPSYTYKECVERLAKGSNSIDEDKCSYILARNIKESTEKPGKFYFARDGRLKYMNKGLWPQEYYVNLASGIKIPHLFINALDTPINEPLEHFQETISILKKNPLFQFEEVRGRHHVHLNNPENVSGIISQFLNTHKSSSQQKSKL